MWNLSAYVHHVRKRICATVSQYIWYVYDHIYVIPHLWRISFFKSLPCNMRIPKISMIKWINHRWPVNSPRKWPNNADSVSIPWLLRVLPISSRSYISWWRHQMKTFSVLLALCAGNSPVTGEFPSLRPVTQSSDLSLICAWINGWVNNRKAGDLRRHRAHYDVTVMSMGSGNLGLPRANAGQGVAMTKRSVRKMIHFLSRKLAPKSKFS